MGGLRDAFLAARPFPPDRFQLEAFDALDAGRNVCVAAPTGSGKTLVAEYALALARSRGDKIFYTTPIKALSNQKFRDLVREHGRERVGLLTGDNSIRGDAPIVVMTTEVLRNMIHAQSPTLDDLGWVVLDEVHYLGDRERGAVWEEVIIHLPAGIGLVCLSATIPNADELGDWIATLRGPTDVVVETTRPVELEERYAVGDRRAERIRLVKMFRNGRPNMEAADFDPRDPRRRGGRFGIPRRAELIEEMDREAMLPAIVFIFSRDGCETALSQVRSMVGRLTDEDEREAIREIAESHTEGLSDEDLRILGYGAWIDSLEAGFAAHHAGIVPPMKEAVEAAFSVGLVKVVFATETLALGINMPARSVVIERLTKFTGSGHEYLTPGEYTQITGRAGRRGIDERGYAITCWSPWTPFADVAALASSPTAPLRSSFRPTYNAAANLIRRYDRDEARHLVNASFAQFHADRDVAALEAQLTRARERLDAGAAPTSNRSRKGGRAARTAKLEGEIRRLERRIRRRSDSLLRHFERVVAVLESWGYSDGWELTDAGVLLAGLSTEMDLLVAESIRTGIFDDLDAAELGAVVSCFTYERRSRDARPPVPKGVVGDRFRAVVAMHRDLAGTERDTNLHETREPDIGFADTVGAWIRGGELGSVLDDELSAGDFVRHVKQCVDLLRQISDLDVTPLSDVAADAAARCMRGLVEASSAVRA